MPQPETTHGDVSIEIRAANAPTGHPIGSDTHVRAIEALTWWEDRVPLEEGARHKLLTALDEIVCNCLQHGRSTMIHLRGFMSLTGGTDRPALRVILEDDGTTHNPARPGAGAIGLLIFQGCLAQWAAWKWDTRDDGTGNRITIDIAAGHLDVGAKRMNEGPSVRMITGCA